MFPLLVVLAHEADPWCPALERLGHAAARLTGHEAIQAVRQHSGEVVLCEQVPGWRALVRGVEDAGGAAVLLGEFPDDVFAELPHARTPDTLAQALAAARARIEPSLQGPSEEEAWARFAETVAAQPDISSCAQEISARVRDLCAAELSLVFLVDAKTGELKPEAPTRGSALKQHLEFARRVARDAVPISHGPLIGAPVLDGGDVIGVLAAVRSGRDFAPTMLGRLALLTRPIASAVKGLTVRQELIDAEARLRESHDALERKVAERTGQISAAKREWEQTFDAIREPIALLEGHVVRRANLAYAALVGLPVQQVVGQRCHQLVAGRDSPCPGCPLGREQPAELPLRGGTFAVSSFVQTLAGGGVRHVVSYRDVSEERRLQARLRETERMASLGQLASGAAHEINNPIGFVISNLRSLREELRALSEEPEAFSSGDAREMIEESLSGAERVSAIVKGLRELSRQSVETVDVADPGASTSRAVRAELSGREGQVELRLEAVGQVPVPPLQLDQLLQNLLRNARQATSEAQRITVHTRDEVDEVLIEVSDAGEGISPEHLPRIFEPFFTTRGVGKGLGLGLTTVYGIVQRHGGSIQVQSQPGTGTRVAMRFRRADYRPIGASASAGVSSRTIAASTDS